MTFNNYRCPKCGGELKAIEDNEFYFMCFDGCLQGWTVEEIEGIQRYQKILTQNNQRVIIFSINSAIGNKLYWFLREIMTKYEDEIHELPIVE